MAYGDSDHPTAPDYYRAGLLASAIGYIGIVLLIAVSAIIGSGEVTDLTVTFFLMFVYGALPAAAIAFLVTAPLGCLYGLALRAMFAPGNWHGAANGVLTVMTLVLGSLLLFTNNWWEMPDAGTVAFLGGLVAVGAGAGWMAQRVVLKWPAPFSPALPEVFE